MEEEVRIRCDWMGQSFQGEARFKYGWFHVYFYDGQTFMAFSDDKFEITRQQFEDLKRGESTYIFTNKGDVPIRPV